MVKRLLWADPFGTYRTSDLKAINAINVKITLHTDFWKLEGGLEGDRWCGKEIMPARHSIAGTFRLMPQSINKLATVILLPHFRFEKRPRNRDVHFFGKGGLFCADARKTPSTSPGNGNCLLFHTLSIRPVARWQAEYWSYRCEDDQSPVPPSLRCTICAWCQARSLQQTHMDGSRQKKRFPNKRRVYSSLLLLMSHRRSTLLSNSGKSQTMDAEYIFILRRAHALYASLTFLINFHCALLPLPGWYDTGIYGLLSHWSSSPKLRLRHVRDCVLYTAIDLTFKTAKIIVLPWW